MWFTKTKNILMETQRENILQELCRGYLTRLKSIANKHRLGGWVDEIITENKNNKCKATEEEVEILSRILDEERISRTDVPKLLGKSYRKCDEADDFDHIKKLRHVGIYSKVSALLYKFKNNGNE